MSTKGVVDIVFCLDASDSMKPCFDAVRQHAVEFLRGFESGRQRQQQPLDWRLDFLAHSCDSSGSPFRMACLRRENQTLLDAIYRKPDPLAFFTSTLAEFQQALANVPTYGDEATLIALDLALDFPWRPRNKTHRVVICLTDEPLATGARVDEQRERLDLLVEKIHQLGVMLYLVAPRCDDYRRLGEADKSEYTAVDLAGDGLRGVDFKNVLGYIGKSVSVASLQASATDTAPQALFGQATWGISQDPIRGR